MFSGDFHQMIGKTSVNIKNIEQARKLEYANKTEELAGKYENLRTKYEDLISQLSDKYDIDYGAFSNILSGAYHKNIQTWQNTIREYIKDFSMDDLAKIEALLKQ